MQELSGVVAGHTNINDDTTRTSRSLTTEPQKSTLWHDT